MATHIHLDFKAAAIASRGAVDLVSRALVPSSIPTMSSAQAQVVHFPHNLMCVVLGAPASPYGTERCVVNSVARPSGNAKFGYNGRHPC